MDYAVKSFIIFCVWSVLMLLAVNVFPASWDNTIYDIGIVLLLIVVTIITLDHYRSRSHWSEKPDSCINVC
jgi:uncharacterized membrane protein